MRVLPGFVIFTTVVAFTGCTHAPKVAPLAPGPTEKHFKSLKQLTFEGTNAESYFSPDGKQLIFQGHAQGQGCDQVYTMNLDGSGRKLVSTKGGRNTCSYFLDDKRVLLARLMKQAPNAPKSAIARRVTFGKFSKLMTSIRPTPMAPT